MILCHCAGVNDSTLGKLIEDGATTVREITRLCGAGASCAPCRSEIAAMLYEASAKRQNSLERGAPSARRAA